MACLHTNQLPRLVAPTVFSKVYKEECTLCFASQDDEHGLDICLSCFNGACTGPTSDEHSQMHFSKTGHTLVLHVKRIKVSSGGSEDGRDGRDGRVGESSQPSKIQKLEIVPEATPEHHVQYTVCCLACASSWPTDSAELSTAQACIAAIISSFPAKKRIDVQAWQDEPIPCDHTKNLTQDCSLIAARLQAKHKCSECSMGENLWMCLTCGSIGCGRKQYDGSGGNDHGFLHFEATKHPVAIKLGTITPEGTADVHCYCCTEMRIDPKLSQHLAAFGIDITSVEKTEHTMAELQLEQNLQFDFAMVSEDGRELRPAHGPGLTGLKNLGNSCYLSSVVQSLFTLETFRKQYSEPSDHVARCKRDPASCFPCQAIKLATGVWSGKHETVSPWMFKAVVSSGHAEFSTARQQDASEFLSFLLKVIQRTDPTTSKSLVDQFSVHLQQSLACVQCGDQRVQTVRSSQLSLQISHVLASSEDLTVSDELPLFQCLEKHFAPETVESRCSKCGHSQKTRKMSIKTLPDILVISLSRYVIKNWVPQKLEMPVQVPFSGLDCSPFVFIAKDTAPDTPDEPPVDQEVLAELFSMGFPAHRCRHAIIETGNSGIQPAMTWLLEHEDDELCEPAGSAEGLLGAISTKHIPRESLSILTGAGFSQKRAEQALLATDLDVERAFDWLLSHAEDFVEEDEQQQVVGQRDELSMGAYDLVSFISHRGSSVHCGHYIAHARPPGVHEWIMFNDERVAVADPQPPSAAAAKAYVYIYQRRRE